MNQEQNDALRLIAELERRRQRGDPSVSNMQGTPEADIMELRQAAQRRAAPSPFKVGDIVTPRADAPIRDHGVPHIVVSAHQTFMPVADYIGIGTWPAAEVFDLILIYRSNGKIHPQRACSWMYELWSEA